MEPAWTPGPQDPLRDLPACPTGKAGPERFLEPGTLPGPVDSGQTWPTPRPCTWAAWWERVHHVSMVLPVPAPLCYVRKRVPLWKHSQREELPRGPHGEGVHPAVCWGSLLEPRIGWAPGVGVGIPGDPSSRGGTPDGVGGGGIPRGRGRERGPGFLLSVSGVKTKSTFFKTGPEGVDEDFGRSSLQIQMAGF